MQNSDRSSPNSRFPPVNVPLVVRREPDTKVLRTEVLRLTHVVSHFSKVHQLQFYFHPSVFLIMAFGSLLF